MTSLFLLLLMVVVASCAVAGVIYVRVQHGPISLKPLAGLIEREINEELPGGLTAQVEDAQIAATDGGRGIEMRLANLRLSTPTGDTVASFPAASIELSGRAMRSLRLVPSRIELIEPRVALSYTDARGWALSLEPRDRKPEGRVGSVSEATSGSALPAASIPAAPGSAGVQSFDMAALIKAASERGRKTGESGSYLREIAVKDAVLSIDNRGVLSEWRIADGSIDLDRSLENKLATARARIATSRGPWTIDVEAAQDSPSGHILLLANIRDLNPRILGLALPQLAVLQPLDLPVSGRFKIEVGTEGALQAVSVALEGSRGTLVLPAVTDGPFGIDKLVIAARYGAGRVDLDTASLAWGNSLVALKGVAQADANGRGWAFGLATNRGQLAAEEFGVQPIALTEGALQGRFLPGIASSPGAEVADEIRFDRIVLAAGGAELSGTGGVMTGQSGGGFFEAKLGPTTADRLKALWPRGVANGARTWVGDRIRKGNIKSGTIKFFNGNYAHDAGVPKGSEPRRLSLALEATDVTGVPLAWLSPIEAPRLLVRLEDNAIEVNIPDAHIAMGANRRLPIKGGRFAAADLEKPSPQGEVTFRATAGVVPVLEILDQSPLKLLRNNQITTEGIDGKADGTVKLSFPLIAGLLARDVAIEAKAKVSDVKVKQIGGAFDAQAGSFAIDVTTVAIDASGEFLVNGVPVKLGWQRILEDNGERQTPLRLSATLDNADRDQLGIDINHIVQGEVPVEVLIERGPEKTDPHTVRLRADLTNAEIAFESIAWKKPRGRTALLQADIAKGKTHKIELQNLRLEGDDIAMQGTAAISADNRLREIELKELALNVVSRLQISAALKTDGNDKAGTWQVRVKGRTFDARDLFKSLLSVGATSEKPAKAGKPSAALELDAEIENVLGHNDVAIRNLRIKLSRRGDKLVAMDGRGTIDGGAPIAVAMTPAPSGSPRLLLADTTDAGQAFRLMGFYPSMQSGRGRLEVNVDGRGPAEKTGILWVDDFKILGDAVVSELAKSPGKSPQPGRSGKQAQAAQGDIVEFDKMKVPFSVGHGQFVVENAYLRGPLQGMALTGKIDFKYRTLNLGGTFIPLQGLNNALGGVPLFGELLSDGVFGLTFAIQGSIAQPQVIVNPFSMVAPGILRELTQMTNPNPQVIPREDKPATAPVEKRIRAAPPSAVGPGRADGSLRPNASPQTGGSWTSETTQAPSPVPAPKPAQRPQKRPPPAAAAETTDKPALQ
ncbi:MAG: hypothetical protein K2Y05_03175 [Hyphomicrobiaceae bacterium]|nr:hypothetical protein [Hyphomicrobiaceae bacterium]